MTRQALRIIDANLNRLKEGLRVCEDVLRFVYDDRNLTKSLKTLRHDCGQVVMELPVSYHQLVKTREAKRDVGSRNTIMDKKKPGWDDLVVSNLKRAEESLRVLEEASKIVAPALSSRFQLIRFNLYELEKKVLARI